MGTGEPPVIFIEMSSPKMQYNPSRQSHGKKYMEYGEANALTSDEKSSLKSSLSVDEADEAGFPGSRMLGGRLKSWRRSSSADDMSTSCGEAWEI